MPNWLTIQLGRLIRDPMYAAWVHEHRVALGYRDSTHSLEQLVDEKDAQIRDLRARLDSAISAQHDMTRCEPVTVIRTPPLERSDFLVGSEISIWEQDGGRAITNPVHRAALADMPNLACIRWGQVRYFDYMAGGSHPKTTVAQFQGVLDGIHNLLGCEPLIKLPPTWDQQHSGGPDPWSVQWLKGIILHAGERCSLYEFGNEPDLYGGFSGAGWGEVWTDVVPQLKRHARQLGLTIYIGGPSWANSRSWNEADIHAFLQACKAAYLANGNDADYLPDFVSTHCYLNDAENENMTTAQAVIDDWERFYVDLKAYILAEFGFPIPVACSEYNHTIINDDAHATDAAFLNAYMASMFKMFRSAGVWLSCQFTINGHEGGAMDILRNDGSKTMLFDAMAAAAGDLVVEEPPPPADEPTTKAPKRRNKK